MKIWAMVFCFLLSGLVHAADSGEQQEQKKNVKYRAGKEINFEQLLIQGEIKKPEISIVTGDVLQGSDGLLKLRENFNDKIAADIGEKIQ